MKIIDRSTVSIQAAQAWALKRGSHERFVNVAPLYWQTAPRYGIPPEIAYAQASHETDKGKYSGVVPADYHNWCGLKTRQGGSNSDPKAHQRFENDAQGVLAHVQHLARYAGLQTLPAGDTLVDPRWSLVTKFTDTVEGLGGAWAPAATYGQAIANLTADLRSFANDGTWGMAAQIPGFQWHPADQHHYQPGRSEKIRGGAQHYTAGTNSLAWLSTTPGTQVSATFLVKHNPTMADRGWQLVRIEDTAWTTAFANPYTVSIEYEHDGKQAIPDIAYDVLAQTWIDAAAYVKAKGLGEIPLTRAGIRGHKEWVNNPGLICPDGIDIDRIVWRIGELTAPSPDDPDDEDVPRTRPDPWGTKHWIANAFVDEIKRHDWMLTGYAVSEGFIEDRIYVQYFERARLELHPGGVVMRGLVGYEAMVARHPERRSR